eukprot:1322224-Amorphochlora_amoeboformis.AAC.1
MLLHAKVLSFVQPAHVLRRQPIVPADRRTPMVTVSVKFVPEYAYATLWEEGGRTRMEAVEAVGARVCRRNHYAYQKRRSMSQMRDGKNGRFASSTSYQNIVGS